MSKMYLISEEKLKGLLQDSHQLVWLEAHGVDNWQGYSWAGVTVISKSQESDFVDDGYISISKLYDSDGYGNFYSLLEDVAEPID